MSIEQISKEQVSEVVDGARRPVALDLWMDDCPPCNMMEPKLQSAAEAFEGDADVFQVKVEESSSLLEAYDVEAMPTVLFFKDGSEVRRLEGLVGKREVEEAFEAVTSS